MSHHIRQAGIIGYWARVHNLNLNDLLLYDTFAEYLSGESAETEFARGWEEADDELRQEVIDSLIDDLGSVGITIRGADG